MKYVLYLDITLSTQHTISLCVQINVIFMILLLAMVSNRSGNGFQQISYTPFIVQGCIYNWYLSIGSHTSKLEIMFLQQYVIDILQDFDFDKYLNII